MKIKQTVAAVCLAAIMATSVGAAAAEARTYAPLHNEGVWKHGCGSNQAGDRIYSEFTSKLNPYQSWAYVQNDKGQGPDITKPYNKKALAEIWQVDYRKPYQIIIGLPKLYHGEWWDMLGYTRR